MLHADNDATSCVFVLLDQKREIIRRYKGEVVGEFGLVSNQLRRASVTAAVQVTVGILLAVRHNSSRQS